VANCDLYPPLDSLVEQENAVGGQPVGVVNNLLAEWVMGSINSFDQLKAFNDSTHRRLILAGAAELADLEPDEQIVFGHDRMLPAALSLNT
jgi:hypothetical protein